MISKKMKYALKALIYLADHATQSQYISANQIAEAQKLPKKFLEQILYELKKSQLINSVQGNKGGYFLAKSPHDISLIDIYRLFEGAIALTPCVSLNFYEPCADCLNPDNCQIKAQAIILRDQTLASMSQISLASFSEKKD
jgi:Rrf2 family protein